LEALHSKNASLADHLISPLLKLRLPKALGLAGIVCGNGEHARRIQVDKLIMGKIVPTGRKSFCPGRL
jgi:hypothetical protein